MKKKKIWLVELNGFWWIKFKTQPLGRWTKRRSLATRVTTEEARHYRTDWKSQGVRIRRA